MVTVQPSDWAHLGSSPLAGIELQRSIERYLLQLASMIKSLLSCSTSTLSFKEVHAITIFRTRVCSAWQGCCSEAAALIPLLAAAYQWPRCLCRTAAQQGGGDFVAPVQRVTDFLAEQPSTGILPTSSYRSAARQAHYFVVLVQHLSWPAGVSQISCTSCFQQLSPCPGGEKVACSHRSVSKARLGVCDSAMGDLLECTDTAVVWLFVQQRPLEAGVLSGSCALSLQGR